MKEVRSKKGSKQIIIITVMIMLFNFIVPNCSYAVSTESGGSLVKVISQFVCSIPDAVINFLQDMFVLPQNIYNETTQEYEILYSPGTIFAGEIPAFNINFINPSEDKTVIYQAEIYESAVEIERQKKDNYTYTEENDNIWKRFLKGMSLEMFEEVNKGTSALGPNRREWDSKYGYYNNNLAYIKSSSEGHEAAKTSDGNSIYDVTKHLRCRNDSLEEIKFWVSDNTLYMYQFYDTPWTTNNEWFLYKCELKFDENGMMRVEGAEKTYKSSSSILQNIVATWYNALRRIALVGLLSVLVYIGIRILLTSTSAKEKAKYKSMLKDWLIALCLLFTLHYVMNITITVVGKINEIIKVSSITPDGVDILMSTVRNYIAIGDNWGSVLAYVVIYCVLGVYTVIFTIQYLRRVIYLAFLTMIAPLITLTYPLDKIKDKKSQAFDMWLKDYIFFSLLQVLHLLIYYIFLGSSLDLANQGNWIFAIVAIGFMTKAEKIMKKMFGFEKSKTLSALGAGATGALVMNAINKISHKPSKGGSGGGQASSAGESSSSNVRTATTNPLETLSTGGVMPVSNPSGEGSSLNSQETVSPTATGGNINTESSRNGARNRRKSGRSSNNTTSSSNTNKPKRDIWNGVSAVTGRYFPTVAKSVLGAGTGLTGAIIGFSTGVAQGDVSKAFTGMVVGATAGNYLARNTVDTVQNLTKEIPEVAHNVADTYREGAYGEDYANNVKFDREFRNSSAYRDLKRDSGFKDKVFDEKVSQMLESGITDTKRMKKILKNHEKHPRKYRMDKAIAYSEMAQKCSDNILYNRSKFIRFCQHNNIKISEEELENLRKCIIDFK